ncbi:double-strand break repair helicase AddA [Afipia carboxidovorans]|uniref:double-strand break repair helicase AddA n=1 Tax=Afipia carboxidovorans TaxID=40137 RepID=UPI0030870614|nr:double-strand break repair helicase AddA [Afipia carboxidovorans]
MSTPRANIPDAVRDAQARASNPQASAFVAANAGSGKTHVLVTRVIRLLLADVAPEKILCITFTKAAAANMAQRVFETLGRWVALDDDALDAAIRHVGAPATREMRVRARKLFACALETPGGLKVQTIHALCTRLLQQFPFEANVPAHFAVLDERDQTEMMERANLAVLLEAARAPDSALGRALAFAMTQAADVTFKEVVHEACLSREHFMAWADGAGSIEAAMAQVCRALGVAMDAQCDAVEREMVEGPHLPRSRWIEAANAFEDGGKTDATQGARLRAAAALTGEAQLEAYLGVFFTGEGSERKSLMTKSLTAMHGALAAALSQEQPRLRALADRRRAIIQRDRTHALLVIASAVAAHYRREKQARGLLDYDDLIDKTHAMLTGGYASWVHFKLDRGIDHVLIDEAQDTSPRQWDIIESFVSEFTAGAGARGEIHRTVFAVGDEKQSIFSFQGAAPREFDLRRRAMATRHAHANLSFESVSFKHSFRSGAAILDSVDYVFREQTIYRSIHIDDAYPVHDALPDAAPATVELWPVEEPDTREEIEGWQAPFDTVSPASPEVKLARRVESEIKALIAAGTMTGPLGRRRRLRYGDVMILVRRRGAAFDAVIQALKHAGIPVAGADRLKLTAHIAVIDLMHLADALLLPQDDLALAVALKSPLFGLTDDDLLTIAPTRTGSLREALAAHAASSERLRIASEFLETCAMRAARMTPFAFFAWLLGGDSGGHGGRARILKRLGHEANDALDEFLELALTYERKAPASLQGFIAWLRAADTDVKRDMEILRDEVRVMTVHGAKGLEASVVFLVDTTTSPSDTQRLRLIHMPHGNAGPGEVVLWAGAKDDDTEDVARARDTMRGETEDEYRRLLYVAMTRAAERLIVGGCKPGNRNNVRELSWYDLIEKGLAASPLVLTEVETPFGPAKRYARKDEAALDIARDDAASAPAELKSLPDWLYADAPQVRAKEITLAPSSAGGDTAAPLSAEQTILQRARLTGQWVHRLLQSLPDLAQEAREAAALRFLARHVQDASEEERTTLIRQVLALIDDPRFAALFGPGSRAEVSIAGRLTLNGTSVRVSGQIDRLVMTPDEVMIVDYKTGAVPQGAMPPHYVRQLALYRAVLAKLSPGRPVRCALLWTQGPQIVEVPPSTLDAELASLARRAF